MEVKGLRLEFEASPRAVDELKAIFFRYEMLQVRAASFAYSGKP